MQNLLTRAIIPRRLLSSRIFHRVIGKRRLLMNQATQMTIQQTIHQLRQHGFHECTQVANRRNGTEYLYAFERLGDEQHTSYCCANVDDLFALWSLVEAFASE